MPSRLDLRTFINDGYLATFGKLFANPDRANVVLDAIEFPLPNRPVFHAFENPELYWNAVANLIDQGVIQAGLEDLVAAAIVQFPYNPQFQRWQRQESVPGDRGATGSTLFVMNCRDSRGLLAAAARLTVGLGIPGPVRIGFDSGDGVVALDLPHATVEQAAQVRDALREELVGGPDLRMGVSANEHRNPLPQQLIVEGPDQARFELNGVPASTPARDVIRAVISQYDGKARPREETRKPRVVVYQQEERLAFAEAVDRGYVALLAEMFQDPLEAKSVLEAAGLPSTSQPRWGDHSPELYWETVCQRIALGATATGLSGLLREAARRFPHNPRLLPFRDRPEGLGEGE